jgi:hypothetical protein
VSSRRNFFKSLRYLQNANVNKGVPCLIENNLIQDGVAPVKTSFVAIVIAHVMGPLNMLSKRTPFAAL